MAPSPPTALVLLVAARRDFVKANVDAGKLPPPAVLASFLQTLVQEMQPHVKAAAPSVGELLKAGLAALGWLAELL